MSASVKIAEIYCNFKFQYFIAISDSTPIIIIEKEHIKLENRGFILFYKLATQLHNDYLYCESNRNTTSGICSTNDLAQTLNKARKKDLWISIGDKGKINYNDVSKAIENIRKKLTNHFDDKNIVHLIKNIYKTGYMLDNNPSRVKMIM